MKKYYYIFSSLLFATAIIISSCSGGGGGGSAPFSQADLTGTWYASVLQTGPTVSTGADAGWIRGDVTIFSSGSLTVPELYTSKSVTPDPGPPDLVWTIDPSTGVITETSGTANPTRTNFHGKLASNKKLIVGTETKLDSQGTNTIAQFRILQKKPTNPDYTSSDIAGKDFMMHQIASGSNTDWRYASGSTNKDGLVSLTTLTTFTGHTIVSSPVGTMSIKPGSGLVTMETNTWFQGMMSPDKTYFVATETDQSDPGIFRLTVAQLTPSSSPSTADLAGSWHVHGLVGAVPGWIYQDLSINSSGDLTITSELTSAGTDTDVPKPAGTAQIDPFGNVTSNDEPTLHATLSENKDLLVTTQTITINASPPYPASLFGVIVR